ncbi:hypothetical protein [Ralstonia pseudosolanacearum]|uniref:hypothetical protein n=1 Tax=Ralstonia pseudosolanacearum TaxID=1310165 RepID=UPI0008D98F85|nr:hypothetical protein [Ralstonia pseudosolanacearum]MCL1621493.1 hypothetical protein [Ralstonia pseudosolanacearum CaRs-Mep]
MGRETGKQRPERDGTGQIQGATTKKKRPHQCGRCRLENGAVTPERGSGQSAILRVRGTTAAGASVYVRDGAIEGAAPALPTYDVEI